MKKDNCFAHVKKTQGNIPMVDLYWITFNLHIQIFPYRVGEDTHWEQESRLRASGPGFSFGLFIHLVNFQLSNSPSPTTKVSKIRLQ